MADGDDATGLAPFAVLHLIHAGARCAAEVADLARTPPQT
jgi:hypothetical protein